MFHTQIQDAAVCLSLIYLLYYHSEGYHSIIMAKGTNCNCLSHPLHSFTIKMMPLSEKATPLSKSIPLSERIHLKTVRSCQKFDGKYFQALFLLPASENMVKVIYPAFNLKGPAVKVLNKIVWFSHLPLAWLASQVGDDLSACVGRCVWVGG